MLDGGGTQIVADALEHRIAFFALVAEYADLDQFVRVEIDVDLLQHGRGEAVLADDDHRMEVMGLRAKRAPRAG